MARNLIQKAITVLPLSFPLQWCIRVLMHQSSEILITGSHPRKPLKHLLNFKSVNASGRCPKMWLSWKQNIQQLKGTVLFNDCYWNKTDIKFIVKCYQKEVEIINSFNAINNRINPKGETLGRGKDAFCKSTAAYE